MKNKIFKIFIIFVGFVIILNIIILSIFSFSLKKISTDLGKHPQYFLDTIYSAYKNQTIKKTSHLNILILGLDERDDQFEKTKTTDTIILASVNLQNAKTTLLSIPRDLWVYPLSSKVNQIYPQSLDTPDPSSYIKQQFGQLFDQPIHHYVTISTQDLIDFVQIIGGVDVYLPSGFRDDQYPNPDYIKNPDSRTPIYKTVEFSSGLNHLNQSNVTEFVRSRKSSDDPSTGGTDLGRIKRQQLLIEAILQKIQDKTFLFQYSNLINLYHFWQTTIESDITDHDLASLAFVLKDKLYHISLEKVDIPVGTNSHDGLIYHPDKFINQQWVFIPNTSDYLQLHQFISASIYGKSDSLQ